MRSLNGSMLFAGSSHPQLAQELCKLLSLPLGKLSLSRFPDGETAVQVHEKVRNKDLFVLQTTALDPNNYLFELFLMIDALKRSGAKSLTAIIPYFGYSRQDRKTNGTPITAKLVANLLTAAGATQLITCDLHADQIEGFFDIPVHHLHCHPYLLRNGRAALHSECVFMAPDTGAVKIAERVAKEFNASLVIAEKKRLPQLKVQLDLIGEIKNREIIIIDDMSSTGNTIAAAAKLCKSHGAKKISVAITHSLLSEKALKHFNNIPIDHFYTSNTIPIPMQSYKKAKVISIAPLIAEAIKKL